MGRWTVASVALVLGASLMTLALTWERHLSPAERGKYLVRALGCDDCHSPKIPGPGGMPIPDAKRLLSGHPEGHPYPTWTPADLERRKPAMFAGAMRTAWAGPWGVSFAANLTPDKESAHARGAGEHDSGAKLMATVAPGSTIGILGGGQLGRMTAMAARTLGYHVHVLDPDAGCAASAVADRVVAARFDDAAAAAELARHCDVVTGTELELIALS